MEIGTQIIWLLILGLPVACISWTVTHEEIFAEFRNYCIAGSKECPKLWQRKFFYLFTCEYCFSFYVSALFLLITNYQLLLSGWRGFLIAEFSLMWVANVYMSLFLRIRSEIKKEKTITKVEEEKIKG
ncbi:hypothetical protein [Daejeonella oryzae]|uniref:hypothetical protein n=1 Tax=Daejeonella oryzae TaxID=1122943 RepID=UPI000421AC1C|nr:hypothetical protein [Daejeonella oryzae]